MKTHRHGGLALLGLTLVAAGTASSQPASQTNAQREVLLEARATATVTGKVIYEDGRPAADIPVAAEMTMSAANEFGRRAGHNRYGGYLRQWMHTYRKQTVTRADGTYTLTGLTTAPYNLTVNYRTGVVVSAGPAGYVAAALENVATRQDEIVQARNITLVQGGRIQGRVLDKDTGQPLKGVLLICQGPQRPASGSASITATTDEQGNFSLRVAPGTSSVYIAGPRLPKREFNGNFLLNTGEVLAERPLVVKSGNDLYAAGRLVKATADDSARLQVRDDYVGLVEVQVTEGRDRQLTLRLPKVTTQP